MKFWSNSDVPQAGTYIPEKRLLAAVLQRAITDFLGGEGEIEDGARSWIMEDDSNECPLTFSFICEALDLDYQCLKKAIVVQKEDQKSSPIPLQSQDSILVAEELII